MLCRAASSCRFVVPFHQVRFEEDVTDDPVAAEEFVDEEDYFQFISGFRTQVSGSQFVARMMTDHGRHNNCHR